MFNIENKKDYIWLGLALCGALVVCGLVIFLVNLTRYENSEPDQIYNQEPIEQVQVPVVTSTVEIEKPEVPIEKNVRLRVVGDMMLDRSVYLKTLDADDFYFPFERIGDFLLDADITLGNLEGAITTNKSIANGTGGQRFYFTFSPNFVEPLTKYFDVVSYANNHALNFGVEGLQQSRGFLDESGLKYFGSPTNDPNNLSIILEKNNIKIGLVAYHQLVGYGFDNVISEIKKLRPDVDVLITYPHWGAEYNTTNPTAQTRREAYAMIDAGADLILGGHPHVIQPVEIYKDKVIFYSLGNFIFDQYFSLETMQGLGVDVNITKREEGIDITYDLTPIHVSEDSQPYVIDDVERDAVLDHISEYSVVTSTIADQIEEGFIDQKGVY